MQSGRCIRHSPSPDSQDPGADEPRTGSRQGRAKAKHFVRQAIQGRLPREGPSGNSAWCDLSDWPAAAPQRRPRHRPGRAPKSVGTEGLAYTVTGGSPRRRLSRGSDDDGDLDGGGFGCVAQGRPMASDAGPGMPGTGASGHRCVIQQPFQRVGVAVPIESAAQAQPSVGAHAVTGARSFDHGCRRSGSTSSGPLTTAVERTPSRALPELAFADENSAGKSASLQKLVAQCSERRRARGWQRSFEH
jgi:hypothetical protein